MALVHLGIVGDRKFRDYAFVEAWVNYFLQQAYPEGVIILSVISGEAKGVDALARQYCANLQKLNGADTIKWDPKPPNGYGAKYLLERNDEIVAAATHIIAFPSHGGSGTQYTIRAAERAGLKVDVKYVD